MSAPRSPLAIGFRLVLLVPLFAVLFVAGSLPLAGVLPDSTASEPGLVPDAVGLLLIAAANTLVVAALILGSRWTGWKLATSLSLAYYGAVTFLMQIETWYFLSDLTVSPAVLPRLFLMGIPTAFAFIPVAVWVLGKWRGAPEGPARLAADIPPGQWAWKLAVVAILYVTLYWLAGYFIAWQNPELRAFYGRPGEALPFLTHTADALRNDPALFPFQVLRGLIWAACAIPVIRGSRLGPWGTALLVALLFSVPQNIGHIVANPLIPDASVRFSHMVETASSMFLFGLLVVWLLHRAHRSPADLLGLRADPARRPVAGG